MKKIAFAFLALGLISFISVACSETKKDEKETVTKIIEEKDPLKKIFNEKDSMVVYESDSDNVKKGNVP